MSRVFLISDIHGNIEPLLEGLFRAGFIDKNNKRQLPRKDLIFSIGDLINGVENSYIGDNCCLDLVGPVIDGVLVGNHEIPYIDPSNCFNGFHYYRHIGDRIWDLVKEDVIGPCLLHDETLISHAGIHSKWGFPSAKEAAKKMEYEWTNKNYSHFLFSSIGMARGGSNVFGGALWCDFNKELQSDFPQIVGHTPDRLVRYKPNAICIDIGAKVSGIPLIMELK